MANLLKETKEILERHSKTFDDVIFIGDRTTHTKMTMKDFLEHANVEYKNGFGIEEINTELILVGKDFWLERHEYDGSEWWEYKSMPNVNDFVDGAVYIFNEAKMNAMYYSRND